MPVVIVLAAGRGRRFAAAGGQGDKLQALLHGRAVLAHVLAAVQAAGLPLHVVTPASGGPGMGDSIAAGVRATAGAPGWLVLPGDLPQVAPASIGAVAQALPRWDVVVPWYGPVRGHPVGFSAACRADLLALAGDAGAAAIVQARRAGGRVCDLPLDDAGLIQDVDTPDDLVRLAGRPAP